jgi:hypothetical protein
MPRTLHETDQMILALKKSSPRSSLQVTAPAVPAGTKGSALSSFESIQGALDKLPNAQSKLDLLSQHAAAYREQGKTHPNCSKEQLSLYQEATKLEKSAAMHLYSDKAAWKSRNRTAVDKL